MSSYKGADPTLRPVDSETGEPLPATKQPGYYPGFSTLSQSPFWDEATRKTVTERVQKQPERRFFTADEWKFWEVVFDHLIPQTDRTPDRRIPLIPPLDARLHANRTAGYRYESMPHDREVYKLGIEAINAEAQVRFGGSLLFLGNWQQEKVIQSLHDGRPQAAPEIWKRMSVHRFWRMIMGDAIGAYYAHPGPGTKSVSAARPIHARAPGSNTASQSRGKYVKSDTNGFLRRRAYRAGRKHFIIYTPKPINWPICRQRGRLEAADIRFL